MEMNKSRRLQCHQSTLPEERARSKASPQVAPSGTPETESGERRGEHKRGSVGTTYTPAHETINDNII